MSPGTKATIIWIAERDQKLRALFERLLRASGFLALTMDSLETCSAAREQSAPPGASVIDWSLVQGREELLRQLQQRAAEPLLIVAPVVQELDYARILRLGVSFCIPRAEAHVLLIPVLRNLLIQRRLTWSAAPEVKPVTRPARPESSGQIPRLEADVDSSDLPEWFMGSRAMVAHDSAPAHPSSPRPAPAPRAPALDSLAQRLAVYLAQLREQDYYTSFGLTPGASPQAVHAAFLSLAKRCHPNRFARESPQVRRTIAEIFALLKHGHSVLMSPERAAAYRAQLSGRYAGMTGAQPPAMSQPIPSTGEVEAWLVVEQLVAQGQFDRARSFLNQGLAADPGRPELRARLAWVAAIEVERTGNTERAVQLYEQAIAYEPGFGPALDAIERLREGEDILELDSIVE